ncbi:MAG: hypothetical protein M3Q65_21660 [Chloroflexota bacterium]|nr:hypothetical protein [Chloroflexota bacterium]
MPSRRRTPIPPSEERSHLELLAGSTEQPVYELIQPGVLFGARATPCAFDRVGGG